MDIAILAATERELLPVRLSLDERLHALRRHAFRYHVTGVGLMHSTHAITRYMSAQRPDLAIQVGVAGTFHPDTHPPASVVVVHSETLGDAGAEEKDGTWKDLFDLGLEDPDGAPYTSGKLPNPYTELIESTGLPKASGVTVNSVSVDASRIERLTASYSPDVESMEGAALHYVCLREGIPFLQIRGISNTVGERDKGEWRIRESIQNLQEALATLLLKLKETGRP
jgi:futalosine hydrolase